jgi:transcriptional regulator with XRE-family HTH domain
MNSDPKQMTATWLREGRLSKGLTQRELAEKSNISVRSIQRIENGDLIPRSYTLKTLAEVLELSFEAFLSKARQQRVEIGERDVEVSPNRAQRIILSVGISLVILLLGFAFVVQAPKFPETTFELLLFLVVVFGAVTAALFLVWRTRR